MNEPKTPTFGQNTGRYALRWLQILEHLSPAPVGPSEPALAIQQHTADMGVDLTEGQCERLACVAYEADRRERLRSTLKKEGTGDR